MKLILNKNLICNFWKNNWELTDLLRQMVQEKSFLVIKEWVDITRFRNKGQRWGFTTEKIKSNVSVSINENRVNRRGHCMTNYETKTFPNHFSSSQLVNISWRIYCNKGINIKINLKCMHVSVLSRIMILTRIRIRILFVESTFNEYEYE